MAVPTTAAIHEIIRPPTSEPRYHPIDPVMVVTMVQRPNLAIAKFTHPDVPEADLLSVILQLQREGVGVGEVC